MKKIFTKWVLGMGILGLSLFFFGCTSNRTDSPVSQAESNKNQAHEDMNTEADRLAAEKSKLEQEKQKLAQDNAKLNKEKKDVENLKNATPPDVDTENWNGDTWQVPNPPSNIRTAPDGKILCTVKDKAKIKLRGTSNIKDKNGEWIYTDYCGQIGFIHSTQVQLDDGVPTG